MSTIKPTNRYLVIRIEKFMRELFHSALDGFRVVNVTSESDSIVVHMRDAFGNKEDKAVTVKNFCAVDSDGSSTPQLLFRTAYSGSGSGILFTSLTSFRNGGSHNSITNSPFANVFVAFKK